MKSTSKKEKKGITQGKKKIRILNVPALIITLLVAIVTGAIAVVCNITGFDRAWYGDIVTTAVCIICFFALLNIGYVLTEGITIENGVVFLGTDREKKPITFHVKELETVRFYDIDLTPIPENEWYRGAPVLRFFLKDGSHRDYITAHISARIFREVIDYFEI